MMNYNPSSEPGTERIMLLALDPQPSYGSDFGSLRAYVVRKAQSHAINPDTGRKTYWDGESVAGVRNTSWMSNKPNALYVEDFCVVCQFDRTGDSAGKLYGSDIVFKDAHRIEAREAEQMHRTFSTVNRKLDKLGEKFGNLHSNKYAELILRVASILGIEAFALMTEYTLITRTSGASNVQYMVDKLVNTALGR
jgi:hypothetical protein